MQIYGIDFTSRPTHRKPITCLYCKLEDSVLKSEKLEELPDFTGFEDALARPGPWIAGIDFPFGQAREFIETIGWPQNWEAYVLHAESLGREGFRKALTTYRNSRPAGAKELRRQTDITAGSISPQKLYGVPVALMFFEGAPRLIHADVTIPHLRNGNEHRTAIEAYPGVLARSLIGRRSYKSDTKKKQTEAQAAARRDILLEVTSGAFASELGFKISAEPSLAADPAGDQLDALLCAIQAAVAWQNRTNGYGAPRKVDPLEGWISSAVNR
jgi:hypothetical protein